jgi:hypothetical protein
MIAQIFVGLAGIAPVTTVTKFVIWMRLFDGIVNDRAKGGDWVKVVDDAPDAGAGLSVTPPATHSSLRVELQPRLTVGVAPVADWPEPAV